MVTEEGEAEEGEEGEAGEEGEEEAVPEVVVTNTKPPAKRAFSREEARPVETKARVLFLAARTLNAIGGQRKPTRSRLR